MNEGCNPNGKHEICHPKLPNFLFFYEFAATSCAPGTRPGPQIFDPAGLNYLGKPGLIHAQSIVLTFLSTLAIMGFVEAYRSSNASPLVSNVEDPLYPSQHQVFAVRLIFLVQSLVGVFRAVQFHMVTIPFSAVELPTNQEERNRFSTGFITTRFHQTIKVVLLLVALSTLLGSHRTPTPSLS